MNIHSREFTILLGVLVCVFIYVNFLRRSLHLDLIKSNVNGQEYYVRKLPDKQEAADKLAHLSVDLTKLVDHVKDKDKEGVTKLANNFNTDIITENIPGSMYVAYSVNKGDELSICIREKNTEKFIDTNTINFVAIHEMAHIMTTETGHTPLFWDNMKYLLEQGQEINIYEPQDYKEYPVVFCGQEINSTPLDL